MYLVLNLCDSGNKPIGTKVKSSKLKSQNLKSEILNFSIEPTKFRARLYKNYKVSAHVLFMKTIDL